MTMNTLEHSIFLRTIYNIFTKKILDTITSRIEDIISWKQDMSSHLMDWRERGFGSPPELKLSPAGGVIVYRLWGGLSQEWPKLNTDGYFSREKPISMLDAELKFNICLWGNRILFSSTFLICEGQQYWEGEILHGPNDIHISANQILIEPPISPKLRLIFSKELIRQDFHVPPPPASQFPS